MGDQIYVAAPDGVINTLSPGQILAEGGVRVILGNGMPVMVIVPASVHDDVASVIV
jgi:hypothetical protein